MRLHPIPTEKKQRVKSFLAKGTIKTRPKPESFVDVVSRQTPVSYEDRMVSIGELVEVTPDLVRALSCFSRNPYYDPGGSASLSLVQ